MRFRWQSLTWGAFGLVPLLFITADDAVPAPSQPGDPSIDSITSPDRFVDLFRPFQTSLATLSPDGLHIAYSLREGDQLSVVVVPVDNPARATARVVVATDQSSTPMLSIQSRERTPAQIRSMGWAGTNRIIVETNRATADYANEAWGVSSGAILAFDLDGGNFKILVTPKEVATVSLSDAAASGATSTTNPETGRDDAFLGVLPDGTGGTGGSSIDFDALTGDDPLADPDSTEPPTPDETVSITRTLRTPRVFDYAPPDASGAIIVSTDGNLRHELFRLDALTGKLKFIKEELGEQGMLPMLDRQGELRIGVPNTTRTSFPHRFRLATNAFMKPWTDLDRIVGTPGGAPGFFVSPDNAVGERAIPIGFDENPDILYFASNIGRDTFGVYSLDVKTGARGSLAAENPAYDMIGPALGGYPDAGALVFDRHNRKLAGIRFQGRVRTTAWLSPEMQSLQKLLEESFPARSVEILDWNESGTRFLLLVRGVTDPGAFCVFDAATGKLAEFVRRAPWLPADRTARTHGFSLATAAGERLSGIVTAPRDARIKPVPVIVICPSMPWERVPVDYEVDTDAIAAMGFAVVQFNGRGAWGFGTKHRHALKDGYDEAQVADILAVLDHVSERFAVNPKRVGLLGRNHGGFIALRAVQMHPDRFRCAVAIEAPVDLASWIAETRWTSGASGPALTRGFLGDDARIKSAPLLENAEGITKPVFLLDYRGPAGGPMRTGFTKARGLAASVKRHGTQAEFYELDEDYTRGLPKARAAAFREIEGFLNATIYDYGVKAGEPEVIEDDSDPKS
jgi:pimeloyl-ACP methyl ester carboxylesterase